MVPFAPTEPRRTSLRTLRDEAWAIDLNALNRKLIRGRLTAGAIEDFAAPTGGDQIEDFTIGTDDIWVVLREKPALLRLDREQPSRLLDRLDLQDEVPPEDSQLFVAAAQSDAWIEIYGRPPDKAPARPPELAPALTAAT